MWNGFVKKTPERVEQELRLGFAPLLEFFNPTPVPYRTKKGKTVMVVRVENLEGMDEDIKETLRGLGFFYTSGDNCWYRIVKT